MIYDPTIESNGDPEQDARASESRSTKYKKGEKKKPKGDGVISLTMPVDTCFAGYATPVLDMRLTTRQAAALKVMWSSLSERGARYKGSLGHCKNPRGVPVENGPAAIRWLLDQIGDAIEKSTGKKLTSDFGLTFR